MSSQTNTLVRTKSTVRQKEKARTALKNPIASIRALTKGSLFYFIQYFWDTYSSDKFISNWHIEYLSGELEKVARRVAAGEKKEYDLIINIPPGSTKTALISIFFPVWCWTNWYWMRFITSSHSSPLSLESAEYSRDIIRSEKFQMVFSDIDIKQDKDSKSNFRVVKKDYVNAGFAPRVKQGGGRVSTSVDARITGFHAHILIPDDLIDPKRALSEVGLKNANDHIDHTLSTRKTSKEISTMIMIMQRLHQDDPTGHILAKKKKNVKVISLPGEILTYKEQVQPPELVKYYINNLLDPKRLSWDALKDLEADLGQYGYAGQIGQKPTPPGGGMFKVDRFIIIDKMPAEVNFQQCIRYWDKAGTQGGGAYTAGVKIMKLKDGRFIIMDSKRGQWGTDTREAIIKDTAGGDTAWVQIGIEQEPGSGGKESAQATVRRLAGYNVYADRPTGDKVYRADPFSVQVNNGNVMILRGDWNYNFIEEYRNFPFGTYKDQVDAGAAAFNKLTAKKIARRIT